MQSEDCTESVLREEVKNNQPSPAETTATETLRHLDFEENKDKDVENEDEGPTPIDETFTVCRQGHESEALQLLRDHPDAINARDDTGTSLLHWAALVNANHLVEYIIGHKEFSDIDYQLPRTKHSALMWAIVSDSARSLLILIQKGASFTLTDSNGVNPLILAIQKNSSQSLLILGSLDLDRGTIMHGDCEGSTAAHWAAAGSNIEALKFLRLMDFDFSLADKHGITPLVRAIKMGRTQSVHVLIENCGCGPSNSMEARNLVDISHDESSVKRVGLSQYLAFKVSELKARENQMESKGALQHFQSVAQEYSPFIPPFLVLCIFAVNFLGLPTVTKVLIGQGHFYFFCFLVFSIIFCFLTFGILVFPLSKEKIQLPPALQELHSSLRHFSSNTKKSFSTYGVSGGVECDIELGLADAIVPNLDLPRIEDVCFECDHIKKFRMKHCWVCGVCIREFDHHCDWINNCVGELNHRIFVTWLISVPFTLAGVSLALCFHIISEIRSRSDDENLIFVIFNFSTLLQLFLITFDFALICSTGSLAGFQIYSILTNRTTYEQLRPYKARQHDRPLHLWENCVNFWLRSSKAKDF